VRCPCCQTDISEAEVLSAAARICVRRRKDHRGAQPKTRSCRWCQQPHQDLRALGQHEATCTYRREQLEPVTADDIAAMAFSYPASAD
jgi:hypothetical protein